MSFGIVISPYKSFSGHQPCQIAEAHRLIWNMKQQLELSTSQSQGQKTIMCIEERGRGFEPFFPRVMKLNLRLRSRDLGLPNNTYFFAKFTNLFIVRFNKFKTWLLRGVRSYFQNLVFYFFWRIITKKM